MVFVLTIVGGVWFTEFMFMVEYNNVGIPAFHTGRLATVLDQALRESAIILREEVEECHAKKVRR